MRLRTIFPCREFDPVEVPIDQLVLNGKLTVYPESEKYFDIDYRAGHLVVAAKSNVGLIPVNDRVAIHVIPRFPIDNLFYILQRSSATLRFIDGHVRTYKIEDTIGSDPISLIGDQLLAASKRALMAGILKRYVEIEESAPFHGSLDIGATVSTYRCRGIGYRHVWTSTEQTEDIFENKIISSALTRLLGFYSMQSGSRTTLKLGMLRRLLVHFDAVAPLEKDVNVREMDLARVIRALPNCHRDYASILWLSYLIHARRGLSIESVGRVAFDTFVVNLADVFEDYVRLLVAEGLGAKGKPYSVKNGNVDQVPLFIHGASHVVKPDIFLIKGEAPVAVLDAKYKPQAKASDRYEVLAFCEALRVKKAFILSPGTENSDCELIGRTAGGVELYLARINLADKSMSAAEISFLEKIENRLS